MAVHVVRYAQQSRIQWGVVRDQTITPIPGDFTTTGELVQHASGHDLADLRGNELRRDDVQVLSPVTRNQQLICLGANYRSHMIDSGVDPDAKSFNMVFRKASSCIVSADSDVVRPSHVALLDYEIELGLVIRRDITAPRVVTDDNLHDLVAGVTTVNDYSARDVQLPQMQFYKGKSYRTFGPVGPHLCLLEAGDMHYLRDLRLTLRVNGEVRQNASTSELVHSPADTLTELSGLQDLHAGDLIATGTPSGCALRVPSPRMQRLAALLPEATRWRLFLRSQAKRSEYLKPGDLVESHIASGDGVIDLGVQHNRVLG